MQRVQKRRYYGVIAVYWKRYLLGSRPLLNNPNDWGTLRRGAPSARPAAFTRHGAGSVCDGYKTHRTPATPGGGTTEIYGSKRQQLNKIEVHRGVYSAYARFDTNNYIEYYQKIKIKI